MVVSVFFFLRVCFLLYRPISNKKLDDNGFIVGCYILPEVNHPPSALHCVAFDSPHSIYTFCCCPQAVPLMMSLVVHAVRVTSAGFTEEREPGGGVGPRSSSQSGVGSSVRGVAGSSASARGAAYSTDGETEADYVNPDEEAQRPLIDA
jgi:hypothetical protein